MKTKKKILIIGVIWVVALYAAISFFNLSIDPHKWGDWGRGIMAYVSLIILLYITFAFVSIEE